MNTIPSRLLVGLFVTLMTSLSFCTPSFASLELTPAARVVAAGDSIAAGVGAGAGESFPDVVANSSGVEMINAGRGGSCLTATICPGPTLLQSAPSEVFASSPDLVLVNVGINDLCHVSDYRFKKGFREMRAMAEQANVEIVFGTLPPYGANWQWKCDEQRVRINNWMRNSDLNIVDFAAALENQRGALRWIYDSGDGLHPNVYGYQAMASKILS